MANQSKYTFSEVERKLDIIKDNQGSDKVLLGDGTYGNKPKDGVDGTDGDDGVGIGNIQKTNTVELIDTYTITFTDGNTTTFTVTNGKDGENGTDGVGIESIKKTSTNGLVDTYTITFTDKNTTTFEVTNGADGSGNSVSEEQIATAVEEYLTANPPSGVNQSDIEDAVADYMTENADNFKGEKGDDGISPSVKVEEITDGHRVTITSADGEQIFNVMDGADGDGSVTDEQISDAVEAYLTENPASELTDEEIVEIIKTYLNTEVYTEIVETGVGFDTDGNVIERTDSDGITDYIPIKGGDNIVISAFASNDNSLVTLVKYDSNKNILGVESASTAESILDTSNEFTQDVMLTLRDTSNVRYIRVCKWTNAPWDFKVTIGREDLKIRTVVEEYLTENPVENKDILDGKKILFVGDSICEGVGASGQPYPYWIQQWHENVTIYNLGVAGMTVAQKDSSITNSMPVRIASGEFENSDYSDADIIVFEGGINDFMNNVKLGYIQKTYEITKFTTFCQGMEYMFNYFKGLFPKARMIFCSTHNLTAYDFNKAQAWWGAASEICTKWGVEFLDLFALICTAKVEGLQLHPDYAVHRDYYAKYLNMALVSDTPLAGARTTNYYKHNAPCMLSYYSGTKSFNVGDTISTSDWRINMVRADLTTYVNVSSSVTYDISDVDNTTAGTYPVRIAYSEDGIVLSTDVEVIIAESGSTTKTLDSISATKTVTSYNVGDTVATDDIIVTATYSDGSTITVTDGLTIDTSNINNATAGEYNIAVSYTEDGVTKSTAIQINIVESGGGSTTVIASGTANDSNNQEIVTWSLDSDGTMTFDSENSETSMATYNDGSQPWHDYMEDIKKAVFTTNIVSTGGNVFTGATNLEEVELQGEAISIGASAFKGCTALKTIDLTKANYIGMLALANCVKLPSEIVLGATALATQAFYYQSQITVIRFTGTPTSIASDAFSNVTGWNSSANLTDIYVPWAEDEVENAPWGASSATIHYNTTT